MAHPRRRVVHRILGYLSRIQHGPETGVEHVYSTSQPSGGMIIVRYLVGTDPDQAVLILSEEILADLRAEGWPVEPGELGENLTVAGLPSDALHAGAQLRLGEVVLELSKPCDPCIVLYSLPYVGVERGPAFLRTLQGRRGWFARVVQGGTVRPDTAVEVRSPN